MKVRLRRITISPEAFFQIMQNDSAWRVAKGIPKGARLKGFTLDPYSQTFNLFIEHLSFDEIEHTSAAPIHETEFERID
jgi:hypothetical protein